MAWSFFVQTNHYALLAPAKHLRVMATHRVMHRNCG
jgi:hypothetical protein